MLVVDDLMLVVDDLMLGVLVCSSSSVHSAWDYG
jgi:hypothetical protein